jgi:thiol-disulfide isomerase/thioredoxin
MLEMDHRTHLRAVVRGSLIALFAALFGMASLWAYPEKGTPAPPLDPINLLQAPPHAKVDWASLKGKVVVLEFWATWCSPCVAGLPHFNQLVESLDPAKFVFLSIDDEDQKDVERFLAKKKMSGWVGVDPSGSIFAWYGVKARPTTVIVDASGKIAAVTEIDTVSAADLQAVAEGKNVAFKPVSEFNEASAPSIPSAEGLLFSVSVSKALPDAKTSRSNHSPTGTDYLAEDADSLFTDIFSIFGNRYVLKSSLPQGRYDLRVNLGELPESAMRPAIQQALLGAWRLQVQPKTVTKPAYILRATEASSKLLSPSASTHAVKRGAWHGGFLLMNGTMDDLAYVLATGMENPVINKTGIEGTFDARFKAEGNDLDSVNSVLRKTLGLELVPGDREMSLTVLEVSQAGGAGTSK